MPAYEKTSGGEVLLRGIDRNVAVGDRVDAEGGFADYLGERDDFEAVDVQDTESREIGEDDQDDDESDDGFDAAEFVDRTPVEIPVEDIEAGDVDDHLDAVAEAAERVTVEDAIGQRRAELEE